MHFLHFTIAGIDDFCPFNITTFSRSQNSVLVENTHFWWYLALVEKAKIFSNLTTKFVYSGYSDFSVCTFGTYYVLKLHFVLKLLRPGFRALCMEAKNLEKGSAYTSDPDICGNFSRKLPPFSSKLNSWKSLVIWLKTQKKKVPRHLTLTFISRKCTIVCKKFSNQKWVCMLPKIQRKEVPRHLNMTSEDFFRGNVPPFAKSFLIKMSS